MRKTKSKDKKSKRKVVKKPDVKKGETKAQKKLRAQRDKSRVNSILSADGHGKQGCKKEHPKEASSASKKSPKKAEISPKSKEPQTMEELLAQTSYKLRGLKKGEEVEGTVTNISKKKMLIDIGAKTEGVILGREYEFVESLVKTLKVGDKIKAVIGMPENERGQILLSLRRSAEEHKWGIFKKYLKTGKEIEVRGLDVNRGGMIARVMDVYGFVPISQFGRQWLGRLEKLYNRLFKVKVIEVDKTKNRLIFSEKAVSEASALAAQEEALAKVKLEDLLEGVVSGIMPFGIFVRVAIPESTPVADPPVGGSVRGAAEKTKDAEKASQKAKDLFLEGLVHISEISWEKVDDLNKIYKIGQKVKVKVLGIDKASNRLNLSIKQLQPDPWADLVKKYPADKKLKGEVTKLAAFGAFVGLKEGIEGLIHISKIPADFDIKVGQKVDVYIENIDLEHRRIALGLVLAKKPVGYK